MTPDELARVFHEAYERLAPEHGYTTRPETRQFDASSPNGRLMLAVSAVVLEALTEHIDNRIEAATGARP